MISLDFPRSQGELVVAGPGADQVQGGLAVGALGGATQGLAVDSDVRQRGVQAESSD